MSLLPPPLALYAHLPWCVRKCPYCDFNSHVAPSDLPQEAYVDRLLEDLEHDLPSVSGRRVQSIFLGGGTPSLFAPDVIARFLRGVRERVEVASDVEVTMEANPGTVERGRFAGYADAGVNRVSLGVQSFADHQLKILGRIHSRADVISALTEIKAAGIENFNLDLMYGLPDQSLSEALDDVLRAIDLRPTHLSHYQLTLEPGTVFYHRPPPLPEDDLTWEMQLTCQAQLAAAGFQQYEVSAYAQRGRQCRHNLNYWTFGDYLGVGAGAHGKLTDPATRLVRRTERLKQPREYLAQTTPLRVKDIEIAAAELPFEFMLNALRLNGGFTAEQFESRTFQSIGEIQVPLRRALERGLLLQTPDGWQSTEWGRRFLNDLQALFLPSERPSARGSTTA